MVPSRPPTTDTAWPELLLPLELGPVNHLRLYAHMRNDKHFSLANYRGRKDTTGATSHGIPQSIPDVLVVHIATGNVPFHPSCLA